MKRSEEELQEDMLCLTLAYEATWILLSLYLELTILIFSMGVWPWVSPTYPQLEWTDVRLHEKQIPCKHLFLPSFLPSFLPYFLLSFFFSSSFPFPSFSNVKVVGLILILHSFPSQYLSLLCMAKEVTRAYRVKCTLYGKMLFAEFTTWQFRKIVWYILYNYHAKAMTTLWFTKN